MSVIRLLSVSLTVANPAAMTAFYCDTLGFTCARDATAVDPACLKAMGIERATATSVQLRLGAQHLELIAFDPPGNPYPARGSAHDPWFQHIAIVVSDIAAAWRRLSALTAISTAGPQRLPPSTGSVTAFKFRDPEGHPLELIQFPSGTGDPVWQRQPERLFLGIDHSAIVVRDVAQSGRFYTTLLGLAEVAHSVNRGVEQERLDGFAPDVVDVVALQPSAESTPHVELLGYHVPPGRQAHEDSSRDVASTRLLLQVGNLARMTSELASAGVRFVSPGVVGLRDGSRAAMVRDPDGHRLLLVQLP